MKVYQVYNEPRSRFGGERTVVDATMRVLTENGHEPRLLMRSSRALEDSWFGRVCAFFGGVYNIWAYREMRRLLEEDRPDVVHVHGVYPMFSPSVLVACRRAGVPVVMTVHNYNLTCPTWYHLYKGRVCEDCVGGHEYRCVLKNCRDSIPESFAYALRSSVARRFRLFHDNVDMLIVLTSFAKGRLLQAGFRDDQMAVVSNPAPMPETTANAVEGQYVAFAGRFSPEKGVETLLAAARQLAGVPFKVAGDGPTLSDMMAKAPRNVEFAGRLDAGELRAFYAGARLVVVPSVWFEQFPMVILEAMALGLPVVASRIGGLPEIVEDGITGCLFEPGNAEDLAEKLGGLWSNPELRRRMGKAGREKVIRQYGQEQYYNNLMAVYQTAIRGPRRDAAPFPILSTNPFDSRRTHSND